MGKEPKWKKEGFYFESLPSEKPKGWLKLIRKKL